MAEFESTVLVKDAQRFLASTTASRLHAAQNRYDYLIERRDRMNDRVRTGLILLNSASLLGVLTALGTELIATAEFGIDVADLAFSASCFITGSILAAAALMWETWTVAPQAAKQFDRLSRLENLQGTLDLELSGNSLDDCRKRMNEVHALPPEDFAFSHLANWLGNFAAGAWLAGMSLPLIRIASLIDWFG